MGGDPPADRPSQSRRPRLALSHRASHPTAQGWRANGSAPDAGADVGRLRRVDRPNDLQLDARRQDVEQPAATTEQHRDQVDLQLVQHPGSPPPPPPARTPASRARCAVYAAWTSTSRSPAAAFACAIALAIPSVT